jgi:23S rRNA (uracil1939-C5)-methyltransferase
MPGAGTGFATDHERLPDMLRRLSKPQALGHVELFSGSSNAVLLRHMAPLSEADLHI